MTQWGLDNLFNPGKRHMDDEKRRLQSTREEIGDNSGGRRIDLEGGKVSIAVRGPASVTLDEDVVSDPALEAEELPAVALATDDAEIVPDLVDEPAAPASAPETAAGQPEVVASVAAVEAVAVEAAPVEAVPVEAVTADEPVAEVVPEPAPEPAPGPTPAPAAARADDDRPIEAPAPAPVVTTPRRKQLSASAWSRRG